MEEGPPAPGLTPVRGSAPDPAGAAPLRPALKSKTFLKGENTLPKMLANLTPLPPPKSQIRKEALRRSFAPPSGSSFDYKMLSPTIMLKSRPAQDLAACSASNVSSRLSSFSPDLLHD